MAENARYYQYYIHIDTNVGDSAYRKLNNTQFNRIMARESIVKRMDENDYLVRTNGENCQIWDCSCEIGSSPRKITLSAESENEKDRVLSEVIAYALKELSAEE